MFSMHSISFDAGFQVLKAEIPENCIKLNHVIDVLSRIQLTQEAREVQKYVFDGSLLGWKTSLWWVLQKKAELSEEDFPVASGNFKKTESFGNFLYSMYCLVEAILDVIKTWRESFNREESLPYQDADEWFWHLCLEQQLGEISEAAFPELTSVAFALPNSQEFVYNKEQRSLLGSLQTLRNRDAKEEEMRKEIKLLKEKANPYSSKTGELQRLIAFSTGLAKIEIKGQKDDMAKSIKDFREAWNKYIRSYEIQLRNLHRGVGGKMTHITGDKICETISGNKIRVVYCEPSSSLKISRRQKKLKCSR